MEWIDIEHELPPNGTRVITLKPFGMQVEDDTFVDGRWLNDGGYVSHWMPINAPGTYSEIMQRPKGSIKPVEPLSPELIKYDNVFQLSDAVLEHCKMMESIKMAQIMLRLEAKTTNEN